MQNIVKSKYDTALKGREIWLAYKRKYDVDDSWGVIMFPSDGIRWNDKMYFYLQYFLEKKYLKYALVLHGYEISVVQNDKRLIFSKMEEGDLESVICYYKLLQFHKNIVVMSLEEPFGNCHIIGQKGITLDDYIRCGLLV